MILLRNGSSCSNAAHVFGAASRSQRARNSNGAGGDPQVAHSASSLLGDEQPAVAPAAAAQQRTDDAGAEPTARERVGPVAVAELADGVLAADLHEREVGVGTDLQAALAGQPEAAGGRAGDEVGEPVERNAAAQPFAEQQRQGRLRAGDPAPGGIEPAGLHVGRAGRVVGADEGHVLELRPQRLGVVAQRGRALGERAEPLHVGGAQHEVMRAGLAGGIDAAAARLGHRGDPLGDRDVDDVQRAAGLLGELERALDGGQLGGRRSRRGPLLPAPVARRAQLRRALGVDGDGEAERGGALHAGAERVVVDRLEVVDPRVAHERLEADHAAGGELVEAVEVAGHEPAPQREVHGRAAGRRGDLGVEGGAVDGGRVGVERHLDAGGGAARGERGGARRPALPVGAARVVEVHVGVDRPREDVQPARVDLRARRLADLGVRSRR